LAVWLAGSPGVLKTISNTLSGALDTTVTWYLRLSRPAMMASTTVETQIGRQSDRGSSAQTCWSQRVGLIVVRESGRRLMMEEDGWILPLCDGWLLQLGPSSSSSDPTSIIFLTQELKLGEEARRAR